MELTLPRPRRWMLVPAALATVATIGTLRARARNEAGDDARPAEVEFMRAMHNAFRRDLDRLEAAAPRVEQTSSVPDGVRAGWDTFRDMLHSHHAAEDEDLWPVLRARLRDADDLREVDAMVDEHDAIPSSLDAVDDALSRRRDVTA